MYKRTRLILVIAAAVILIALILVLILQDRPTSGGQTPAVQQTEAPSQQQGEGVASPSVTMPTIAKHESDTNGTGRVISAYFDAWNLKDTAAMDAFLIERDRGKSDYSDLPYEESITMTSIQERPTEEALSRYNPEWYDGSTPSEIALVLVDYNITYNEEGKTLYLRDGIERRDYQFWLVRSKPDSDWQIIMQGY